jgi:G3E family GTPase
VRETGEVSTDVHTALHTDVYLISGFLGAGKTTFLNRLIAVVPPEVTFLILMNEFGEVGLDGVLVEGEDLDMIEISKGSIFCACVKTDFIKALHQIATTVRPDVMLIETTGVANPKDLDRDLQLPIFGGAFRLRDKFCLIDAANFLDTYASFLAIEKQLEASDVFIVNKVDLAEPGDVDRIKNIIREFHPDPRFYEATFADVPFTDLFGTGSLRGAVAANPQTAAATSEAVAATSQTAAPGPELSDEALDEYIERLLDDETAEVTPPDRLQSLVVRPPVGSLAELRAWFAALPPRLVRGKGILWVEGGFHVFSLVCGRWTLEPYGGNDPGDEVAGRVVFISLPEDIRAIQNY